ncbi:TrmB family transcriptional regulator [Candidatus Woesearchaeota archaeon]|jgi:HTH-type transcriptional regulator, sugar sensing transcriptional regulator|nr:TrmB family transcriptional regulator [Candidatus Woesearchaeota archaeon]
MDISHLKEAGLTDGEIKVYLALLELGSSTTGPIIEKSRIARSIIYQILEKLMQKGLVSYITKDKTKYFQASSPGKILEFIENREILLKENKKKVEEMLPQLLLHQKMQPKSEANIYTGFKGLRTAHEHTYQKLKKGEFYYYLGIPASQPEEQHLYWQRDHVKRIKTGIKCKLLFNKDTKNNIIKNRTSYKGVNARRMPVDLTTPAMFLIYKDTIVIFLQSPIAMAVEIINQQVADSMKQYFDYFWDMTK